MPSVDPTVEELLSTTKLQIFCHKQVLFICVHKSYIFIISKGYVNLIIILYFDKYLYKVLMLLYSSSIMLFEMQISKKKKEKKKYCIRNVVENIFLGNRKS